MSIVDAEALAERVRNLGPFNGVRLVLVTVPPGGVPDQATLTVHFHNANGLAAIVAEVAADATQARAIFPISGGHRRRAGSGAGQVQVTAVVAAAAADALDLTVAPIGDYSTYTLAVHHLSVDPAPPPNSGKKARSVGEVSTSCTTSSRLCSSSVATCAERPSDPTRNGKARWRPSGALTSRSPSTAWPLRWRRPAARSRD